MPKTSPVAAPSPQSLRDRLARVHARYLTGIEETARFSTVPGVALKVACAVQLLDEARASLSAHVRHMEATK